MLCVYFSTYDNLSTMFNVNFYRVKSFPSNCWPEVLDGWLVSILSSLDLSWTDGTPFFLRIWASRKCTTSFHNWCFGKQIRNKQFTTLVGVSAFSLFTTTMLNCLFFSIIADIIVMILLWAVVGWQAKGLKRLNDWFNERPLDTLTRSGEP